MNLPRYVMLYLVLTAALGVQASHRVKADEGAFTFDAPSSVLDVFRNCKKALDAKALGEKTFFQPHTLSNFTGAVSVTPQQPQSKCHLSFRIAFIDYLRIPPIKGLAFAMGSADWCIITNNDGNGMYFSRVRAIVHYNPLVNIEVVRSIFDGELKVDALPEEWIHLAPRLPPDAHLGPHLLGNKRVRFSKTVSGTESTAEFYTNFDGTIASMACYQKGGLN